MVGGAGSRPPTLQNLNDRISAFLEDAKRSCSHRDEVVFGVADLGLDGGYAAGAVDDLGGAGDGAFADGAEEMDVERDGRGAEADEGGEERPMALSMREA